MSSDTPESRPWFTAPQRRLISTALCALALAVLAWLGFKIVETLRVMLGTFSMVIWPLAIAIILAMLLRPLVNYFEQKLKFGRVQAIVLLYLLVALTGLAIAALLIPFLVAQGFDLASALPDLVNRAFNYLKRLSDEHPDIFANVQGFLAENQLQKSVETLVNEVQSLLMTLPSALLAAGATMRRFFEFAAAAAVLPIYLFFLLETNRNFMHDVKEQLSFLPTPYRQDVVFLIGEFGDIMLSFFQGQLLVGLILGVLKAIGFTAIGIQGGFFLGLMFGLLNIVPYLGTILGLSVILPIAYFQTGGGFVLLLEAVGVFAGVQLLEAYIITPKIMGHRTGLHPMVIILSIFFWGEALHGILGMILAVPLTAFLVVVWRLLKSKYLPRHGTRAPYSP